MNQWSYLALSCIIATLPLSGSESTETPSIQQTTTPFTGKVTRQSVRLRLGASIDSPIIDELDRGDLFLVTGEKNDFYAVKPSTGFKSYIFRTFVLDGTVEGSRVNVRIEPHLDSPILAQLNTGDEVEGLINERNPKWLEITPPESVRFFIAKEYIEWVGESEYLTKMEKRKEALQNRLTSAIQKGESELKKTFVNIELDPILIELKTLIDQYPDFPKKVKQSKKALASLQERYLDRKLAYFETQLEQSSTSWQSENEVLKDGVRHHLDELADIEEKINTPMIQNPPTATVSNKQWQKLEQKEFEKWKKSQEEPVTIEDFYASEEKSAKKVHGMIEPYTRPVKNKPGNFMLISPYNQLPLGFLYSTFFDLSKFTGSAVTLIVAKRDNHHFAYPAYFVIDIE